MPQEVLHHDENNGDGRQWREDFHGCNAGDKDVVSNNDDDDDVNKQELRTTTSTINKNESVETRTSSRTTVMKSHSHGNDHCCCHPSRTQAPSQAPLPSNIIDVEDKSSNYERESTDSVHRDDEEQSSQVEDIITIADDRLVQDNQEEKDDDDKDDKVIIDMSYWGGSPGYEYEESKYEDSSLQGREEKDDNMSGDHDDRSIHSHDNNNTAEEAAVSERQRQRELEHEREQQELLRLIELDEDAQRIRIDLQMACQDLGMNQTFRCGVPCVACHEEAIAVAAAAAAASVNSCGSYSEHTKEQQQAQTAASAAAAARLAKLPSCPCLICGTPTCKLHACGTFRKEGLIVCRECTTLFQTDHLLLDCLTHNKTKAGQGFFFPSDTKNTTNTDATEEGDSDHCNDHSDIPKKVQRMVDTYQRALSLLKRMQPHFGRIADELRASATRHNQTTLGSSATGMVGGALGIAAAATLTTPVGPPLLLTSLVLGSGASTVQTTSKVWLEHRNPPLQIVNRVLALYGMLKSVLVFTSGLRYVLLRECGVPSLEAFSSSYYESVLLKECCRNEDEKTQDNRQQLATVDHRSPLLASRAAVGAITAAAVTAPLDAAVSSTALVAAELGAKGGSRAAFTAASASASVAESTGNAAASAAVGTTGGANNARNAFWFSGSTSGGSVGAAAAMPLLQVAGGVLSGVTLLLEAAVFSDTIQAIRAGNPCAKAQLLEAIARDLECCSVIPSPETLHVECGSSLETLAARRRLYTQCDSAALSESQNEELSIIPKEKVQHLLKEFREQLVAQQIKTTQEMKQEPKQEVHDGTEETAGKETDDDKIATATAVVPVTKSSPFALSKQSWHSPLKQKKAISSLFNSSLSNKSFKTFFNKASTAAQNDTEESSPSCSTGKDPNSNTTVNDNLVISDHECRKQHVAGTCLDDHEPSFHDDLGPEQEDLIEFFSEAKVEEGKKVLDKADSVIEEEGTFFGCRPLPPVNARNHGRNSDIVNSPVLPKRTAFWFASSSTKQLDVSTGSTASTVSVSTGSTSSDPQVTKSPWHALTNKSNLLTSLLENGGAASGDDTAPEKGPIHEVVWNDKSADHTHHDWDYDDDDDDHSVQSGEFTEIVLEEERSKSGGFFQFFRRQAEKVTKGEDHTDAILSSRSVAPTTCQKQEAQVYHHSQESPQQENQKQFSLMQRKSYDVNIPVACFDD